jgi:hypothetical protein
LILLLLLFGCDQQPPTTTPTPAPTLSPIEEPTEEPEPQGDEVAYVVFPEIGEVEVALACQFEGPDGPVYRAELENGGSLQLRKLPEGILHASAQPTPEADPVGTNVPSDTSFTEEGGWLSGESLMWLPESELNMMVEYHVRWDDSIPACDV